MTTGGRLKGPARDVLQLGLSQQARVAMLFYISRFEGNDQHEAPSEHILSCCLFCVHVSFRLFIDVALHIVAYLLLWVLGVSVGRLQIRYGVAMQFYQHHSLLVVLLLSFVLPGLGVRTPAARFIKTTKTDSVQFRRRAGAFVLRARAGRAGTRQRNTGSNRNNLWNPCGRQAPHAIHA